MSSDTRELSFGTEGRAASGEAPGAAINATPGAGSPNKDLKLRTLAPEYKDAHHSVYVRHLENAVQERRNRNIALTGRYGAGKSSVLDQFERNHRDKTVRISISTLGPDDDDEDLTNRIQKELVKQLVYRLRPGQVRRSRFARPKPLTRWRAFAQALSVTVIGLSLLWLLGVRPANGWPGDGLTTEAQVLLGLAFFCFVLCGAWGLRWVIGDRIVSEVTTGSTKIALGDGPTTYFDSFLDEIVAFFDAVEPDFVIFEDLDRFDDPQIFDSLRELNTLINASAHWKDRAKPLRFIYAIKDSLFEQLGAEPGPEDEDPKEGKSESRNLLDETGPDRNAAEGKETSAARTAVKAKLDVAAEAVRRANRTKFFELVIPIVPFLSHRNARDHLADALRDLGFPKDFVSRPLLDLVARDTTDMRLMINICNEFAVFVERLLWTGTPAPGMTADHLFALVAYKNFHMADFEDIAQSTSTLDVLERHHRDDVRSLIERLQAARRDRARVEELRKRRNETAAILGRRLRDMNGVFPNQRRRAFTLSVGEWSGVFDDVDTVEFWANVAKTKSITIQELHVGSVTTTAEQIERLFPELDSPATWLAPDPAEHERLRRRYDEDIATLRGADFVELAGYERVPKDLMRFEQRITDELQSKLACDLVRRGFITRNYAEYSAIFYGSFVGVDVAYFYNHSVQPNEMYLDYHFTSKNAVRNLLEQVPSDFTSTVSALNIEVVDYLLTHRPEGAKEVAAYLASHETHEDVKAFLDAYFNTPDAQHSALVGHLAAHPWRSLFEHLAGHPAMPDVETRLRMFDVALLGARSVDSYELGEAATELLDLYHPRMEAITASHASAQTERVFEILEAVELVIPDLSPMARPLRERIVTAHMYEISVPNLKLALRIDNAPTLDEVRKNEHVWSHCRSRIDDYLQAMQSDKSDGSLVLSERVLIDVLNEQVNSWTDEQLQTVIDGSAVGVMIADLQDVPESCWPMLAESRLISPSAANAVAYEGAYGVDQHLAGLLAPGAAGPVELQAVDDLDDDARAGFAVSLLNAYEHLTAEARVALAAQVSPADGFDLVSVAPSQDQLLARGLEAGLFVDDLATFSHFAPGGWKAMSEAFDASKNVSEFMSPAILQGFVAEFLSGTTPKRLRGMVVDGLAQYVPDDDAPALRAAGEFARAESVKLPLDEVQRIARVTKAAGAVMRQLVLSAKDLSPAGVVEILVALGTPYDKLAEGPGSKFDYPGNVPSIDTVFKRLEEAGRIKITKKAIGSGRSVEVLA
ncbi:ABC transporter ATP-binding protein [Microbacterium sp. zg.Y1090]|uniref:ATP-binding cassette domain-containing protein n=1 Tax=Microbacterium wangruii TaxID=3049073 RepID=UPI00214D91EA|nr:MULTISPECIES: ABC transporter ATP-binding protein [unclassified Microbacterium]MCR2818930.1 ABC transporter ATP-binding protein [Microbacterium sp. zg.Y1090]WIM27237.1 ABC transporter ATP-binding protein [Microbacterium sp. zg-Y1090]